MTEEMKRLAEEAAFAACKKLKPLDWTIDEWHRFVLGAEWAFAQQSQVLAIAVEALKKISFLESFETDAESLIDFARISIGEIREAEGGNSNR